MQYAMKKLSAIIMGYGMRGQRYAEYAINNPEQLEIIGVAEKEESKREHAKKLHSIPDNMVFDDWKKLAEISKEDFKKTYETLNEKYPFKKNSVAYKLYHDLDSVQEKKKEVFHDCADYTAYTEGDRAYIKFTLKPKRQLIVALKSRGWWWNTHENAWSTYLNKLDKEWVSSISEKYEKYV